MKTIKSATILLVALASFTTPARGMIIIPVFTSNVTSLSYAAQVESAMNYACTQYGNLFSNPITIYVHVDAVAGTSVLGDSKFNLYGSFSYSQVYSALLADKASVNQQGAIASLSASSDPTSSDNYWLPTAQSLALGIDPRGSGDTSTAGTFTFGEGYMYTFDPNNRAVSGKYDFIGLAEHEISEIMGRTAGVGTTANNGYMVGDLFRYTGPGVRSLTQTESGAYLSIDGGATNLKNYNPSGNGGDLGDWASGQGPDSYNAFSSPGVANVLTAADITQMAVLGYNLAPDSWNSNGSSTDFGAAANWNLLAAPNVAGQVVTFGLGSQANITLGGAGYTCGQLVFNNTTTAYNLGSDHTGSLTLNNSGSGATISVNSGSSSPVATPTIGTTLILADSSKSTTFNIAGNSALVVAGSINESIVPGQQITLLGGGTLELDGANAYTGGTIVTNGTLNVGLNGAGTLGTGPLAINGASSIVNVGTAVADNALAIGSLSGTGAGQLKVAGGTTLSVNQATTGTFAGTLSLGTGGALVMTGPGNLNLTGTLSLAGSNALVVGNSSGSGSPSSSLQLNVGGSTVGPSVTASVYAGGTLQLSGPASALSGTTNITTHGTGLSTDGALTVTGATTQTVGIVSGDNLGGPATTYSGNTTVGDGANVANLTAAQILQTTLTINAGSTVTIAPSGVGGGAGGTSTIATDAVAATAAFADGSTDPFMAIQAAILSGSISSIKGQQLENRLAAIERLAISDPGLDVSLLENRVIASLPPSSILPSSASILLNDTESGLLTVDGSTFISGSGGPIAKLGSEATFAESATSVPEPSTLLLAALGGILLALAARAVPQRA